MVIKVAVSANPETKENPKRYFHIILHLPTIF